MRITCPDCKNVVILDDADADAGREAECPRCRGTILVPDADDSRSPNWDAGGPIRPWRGRGVTALVLGLLSVPGAACCGLGGLLGVVGFILGTISLRTPSRGAGITGAFFGAVGVVLSLGVLLFVFTLQSALQRPVPPAADDTPPPFAGKL